MKDIYIIIKLKILHYYLPKLYPSLLQLQNDLMATIRWHTFHWAVGILQPWWPSRWSAWPSLCKWQSACCICGAPAGRPASCSTPSLFWSPQASSTWPAEPEPAAGIRAWRRDEWEKVPKKTKQKKVCLLPIGAPVIQRDERWLSRTFYLLRENTRGENTQGATNTIMFCFVNHVHDCWWWRKKNTTVNWNDAWSTHFATYFGNAIFSLLFTACLDSEHMVGVGCHLFGRGTSYCCPLWHH